MRAALCAGSIFDTPSLRRALSSAASARGLPVESEVSCESILLPASTSSRDGVAEEGMACEFLPLQLHPGLKQLGMRENL